MGKRAFVTAAALALSLSLGAVAHTQQKAPDTAPATDLQAAGVKRVKEMIEVINSGDYATMRAYFGAQIDPNGFVNALGRYRLSRGYDLLRVELVPNRPDLFAGIVRNRLRGDEEYLAARIESQPPYRIVLFQARVTPDEVVASWKLKPVTSTAVTEEERLQEIGAYLKRMSEADLFWGTVVIARDGKPVFAQGYGYANREKKIPNTLDTPFMLASTNKIFTGLAIGQLVEQGKLSYDDPLSKFLPDFPDPESAKKIRIKHLLSHTSGLAREGAPLEPGSIEPPTTVKAMIEGFARQPLAFEPGTKHAYSNIGFVLLGRVIEIVTAGDYYDYIQKNVFARAGATSASFPLFPKNGVAVVPMAYPYESDWDSENRLSFQSQLGKYGRRGSPAGDSVASALDILRLSTAMRAGKIVRPETFRLHSSGKPELSSPIYGYGIIAGPYLGRPFVGHNGRSFGHCTEFGELRDTPYTIVVLSNLGMYECRSVTQRILRVLGPTEAAQNTPNFVGTWRNDMSRSKTGSGTVGPDQTITVEGNTMTVTQTTAGNSNSKVLILDGSPQKSGDAVVTSKWEGNVIVSTTTSQGGERIEKRSLEPDGAMKVELIYHFSADAIAKRPAGAAASEHFYRVYTRIK